MILFIYIFITMIILGFIGTSFTWLFLIATRAVEPPLALILFFRKILFEPTRIINRIKYKKALQTYGGKISIPDFIIDAKFVSDFCKYSKDRDFEIKPKKTKKQFYNAEIFTNLYDINLFEQKKQAGRLSTYIRMYDKYFYFERRDKAFKKPAFAWKYGYSKIQLQKIIGEDYG